MSDILNIDQVAELLLCEPATAAEQFAKGVLPGLKFGRQWIAPRQAFFERLNALALEQAAERRESFAKRCAPVGVQLPPVTRGRRRNIPPVLPTVPQDMHNRRNP